MSVIKAIQAKSMYDVRALHKLKYRIRTIKYKQVTVIIDKNLKMPSNIIQCSVFETLAVSGTIEIFTFEKLNNFTSATVIRVKRKNQDKS